MTASAVERTNMVINRETFHSEFAGNYFEHSPD